MLAGWSNFSSFCSGSEYVRFASLATGEPFQLFNCLQGRWSQTIMSKSLFTATLDSFRGSGLQAHRRSPALFSVVDWQQQRRKSVFPGIWSRFPRRGAVKTLNRIWTRVCRRQTNAAMTRLSCCRRSSFGSAPGATPAGNSRNRLRPSRTCRPLRKSGCIWLLLPKRLTGKETEKQITEQVDAFLKQAPLAATSVRGVIVEPGTPHTASDLYVFALAASGRPGQVGQHRPAARFRLPRRLHRPIWRYRQAPRPVFRSARHDRRAGVALGRWLGCRTRAQ